jgi:hypothetical protein
LARSRDTTATRRLFSAPANPGRTAVRASAPSPITAYPICLAMADVIERLQGRGQCARLDLDGVRRRRRRPQRVGGRMRSLSHISGLAGYSSRDKQYVVVPQGEVVEIVGRLSSGRTSLLTSWLTTATTRGDVAALVDADDVFDPGSAARAGVDGRRLLWVRCGGRRRLALRAADLLLRCPGFALVALDLGESGPRLSFAVAFRLRLAARRSGTALIILAGRRVAGPGASLALLTERCGLAWSGPPAAPTRLARLDTALRVLRRRGGPSSGDDRPPSGQPPLRWTA